MSGAAEGLAGLLDQLCPMHALLDATGHIAHAGPTLARLCPKEEMTGARFLELFELRRPARSARMDDLRALAGRGLHLMTRGAPRLPLKAVLTPLPEGGTLGPPGGALVNMSFGIAVTEAIRQLNLTARDFAATDLTVEMLYLIEAKTAAMEASRLLNLRLQGAKAAAEEQAFTDTLTGLKNRRADTADGVGDGFCAGAARSRLFQGGERSVRPCGGRPCAAARGAGDARRDPQGGCAAPGGRR